MTAHHFILILSDVKEYLLQQSLEDRKRIAVDMHSMHLGRFDEVTTKPLHPPIRELISGPHRVSYVLHKQVLYFMQGWRKTTKKTPKTYIDFARKLHKEHIQKRK